VFQFNDEHLMK